MNEANNNKMLKALDNITKKYNLYFIELPFAEIIDINVSSARGGESIYKKGFTDKIEISGRLSASKKTVSIIFLANN